LDTVVSVSRSRGIIEGQEQSAEGLHEKKENCDTAEDLTPSTGSGDLFVEKVLDRRFQPSTVFDPVNQSVRERFHAPDSVDFRTGPNRSLSPSTFVSYRSRGRGAGPLNTSPSIEKV